MKNIISLLVFFIVSNIGHAEESCERGRGLETAYGKLVSIDCSGEDNGRHTSRELLELNGKKILESEYLYNMDSNKSWSISIYKGKWKGRPALYLLDISKTPAVVIAFGVSESTNDFGYVSWGKKNSVIAIKRNAKFTYYPNGKMIPPSQEDASAAILDAAFVQYRADGSPFTTAPIPFVEYLNPPGNQ